MWHFSKSEVAAWRNPSEHGAHDPREVRCTVVDHASWSSRSGVQQQVCFDHQPRPATRAVLASNATEPSHALAQQLIVPARDNGWGGMLDVISDTVLSSKKHVEAAIPAAFKNAEAVRAAHEKLIAKQLPVFATLCNECFGTLLDGSDEHDRRIQSQNSCGECTKCVHDLPCCAIGRVRVRVQSTILECAPACPET